MIELVVAIAVKKMFDRQIAASRNQQFLTFILSELSSLRRLLYGIQVMMSLSKALFMFDCIKALSVASFQAKQI